MSQCTFNAQWSVPENQYEFCMGKIGPDEGHLIQLFGGYEGGSSTPKEYCLQWLIGQGRAGSDLLDNDVNIGLPQHQQT